MSSYKKTTSLCSTRRRAYILVLTAAVSYCGSGLGGSFPFFLALTGEYAPEARKALSWRIAMNSFALLVGSYFIGTYILAFFGISLPVVQVGGGLIVVAADGRGLAERKDDEKHRRASKSPVVPQDTFKHAFYPLTMPLTVGPGSISVAVTLGANAERAVTRWHPLTIRRGARGLRMDRAQHLSCATDSLTGWPDCWG